jgi:ABC-type transport system involved in cytochrome c biogenesis permease subunit
MKRILVVLYIGMVAVLAAATVLERLYGSAYAELHIYHSLWFCFYWGVLAVLTVASLATGGRWKRPGVTLLHLAFVGILAGAMTTFTTARKGLVHLPQGQPVREYLSESTNRYHQLPFTLQLDSFHIAYDPVSHCPADYISDVRLNGQPRRIQMNRILSERGVRLYQSSYDDDEQGSWLALNCDPWGIPLTYLSYGLLAFAWIILLVAPGETFRRLSGRALRLGAGLTYLIVLGITYAVFHAKSATLMPVLRSGWFVAHVSLVSAAYMLLFVTWVASVVSLCLARRRPHTHQRLAQVNHALLFPAVAMLTAGIFVGAVWANVSWGRYWGWDPKEVWALITLMLYALPLHRRVLPAFGSPSFCQGFLALAFLAVLATYFGVNLLLGGMHSYA